MVVPVSWLGVCLINCTHTHGQNQSFLKQPMRLWKLVSKFQSCLCQYLLLLVFTATYTCAYVAVLTSKNAGDMSTNIMPTTNHRPL